VKGPKAELKSPGKRDKTGSGEQDAVFLIVGLGNPGSEYERTRHNVGFMVAEHFRRVHDLGRLRRRYHGRWCEGRVQGRELALLMPWTFMNNSGVAVAAAAGRKHIRTDDIVVIHDDMDFPFGAVRARAGGGSGGHRGLESIIKVLGSDLFSRVRVGIGRPDNPFVDPREWVLSKLEAADNELGDVIERAADCVEIIVTEGIQAAMNTFNRKDQEEI
jgi:PTH1 family peptidyl-tRNA hydrolase